MKVLTGSGDEKTDKLARRSALSLKSYAGLLSNCAGLDLSEPAETVKFIKQKYINIWRLVS